MQISAVKSYNFSQPQFTSWKREVYNSNNSIKYRNDTWLFRSDLDWQNFIKYIDEKYKNIPKVNVYDFACSNGSEPYSLLIAMLTFIPKERIDKFLPIRAKDYDSYAIYNAQKHQIPISDTEIIKINNLTNKNMIKYFVKNEDNGLYRVTPLLTDKINFSVSNIEKKVKYLKPNNSIILARNFWPYIDNYCSRKDLIANLYKQMGENSILVIGDYDSMTNKCKMNEELLNSGFKETPIKNVYEKCR